MDLLKDMHIQLLVVLMLRGINYYYYEIQLIKYLIYINYSGDKQNGKATGQITLHYGPLHYVRYVVILQMRMMVYFLWNIMTLNYIFHPLKFATIMIITLIPFKKESKYN